MNPRLATLLTRLYPRAWRDRYATEFEELLENGAGGFSTLLNVAWSGLRERMLPPRTADSGRFHAFCARAPWAIFSLVPAALLCACYAAACLILWIGWTVFLPERITPFGSGPHPGWINLYFQCGKYFYGCAPILVGWVVAVIAARQRVKAIWPLTSFLVLAWLGAAARIQASRTEIPAGLWHIRMHFALWPWAPSGQGELPHALVILLFAVPPYLLWRTQARRTTHA